MRCKQWVHQQSEQKKWSCSELAVSSGKEQRIGLGDIETVATGNK